VSAEHDARRERWAVAAAIGGAAAATSYVVQRLWERSQGMPQDPRLILYDPHIAFFYRALAASWWGGVGLAFSLALVSRPSARARAVTLLRAGAIPAVVVMAIASYLWP
jgi:hypothetical protein